MKAILIIEDESAHFIKIKAALESASNALEILPNKNNDTDIDLDNRGHLMDLIIKNNREAFLAIIDHFTNIDLFIVDVSLYSRSSEDKIGIDFLNFLKQENYRFGHYKILITSRHNYDSLKNLDFDFDPSLNYVSKSKWDDLFPMEIVKSVKKLLDLDTINSEEESRHERSAHKFYSQRWWIALPEELEKHLINRYILLVTYLIVIATGFYAVWGTISQTYHILIFNSSATEYLEYVEHIYLYFLPLFIVFSFLSYYKSTIEIKLTGGNSNDIDHKGAMNSLDNSKLILLSSISTFSVIKIIERIFVDGIVNITSLISYGVLLVILLVYNIILHRISN